MNTVNLIGRMVRDPELRYAGELAIAKFSLAVDRPKKGETDFPRITALGKSAELVDKYLHKGQLVGVTGRLQTGSYEKDGQKIYTTEVVVDRVTFIEWADKKDDIPSGFGQITDADIPF